MEPNRPNYVAAAFNARPLGMPIPPNWLAVAAIGLAGWFLGAGAFCIGLGLEVAYLFVTSRLPAFRAAVDAAHQPTVEEWEMRRRELLRSVDEASRRRQDDLERRCREIAAKLASGDASALANEKDLGALCMLHLRLLVARGAVVEVVQSGDAATKELTRREAELQSRLTADTLGADLRASLEGQVQVIAERRKAHQDAAGRLALIEAELERIAQKIELARENVLLATDSGGVARSMDLLADTLGSASRLLREQVEMGASLDGINERAPEGFLRRDVQS